MPKHTHNSIKQLPDYKTPVTPVLTAINASYQIVRNNYTVLFFRLQACSDRIYREIRIGTHNGTYTLERGTYLRPLQMTTRSKLKCKLYAKNAFELSRQWVHKLRAIFTKKLSVFKVDRQQTTQSPTRLLNNKNVGQLPIKLTLKLKSTLNILVKIVLRMV